MKPPENWEEVIDGTHYSTKTSILIARGIGGRVSRHEEIDWNVFLYRTPEGLYFKVNLAPSESRKHVLEPIGRMEALHLFGTLGDRCVDLEDAFPAAPSDPPRT